MCIGETDFWFRSFLRNYISLNDIHILSISSFNTNCSSAIPTIAFDAWIWNLLQSLGMHWQVHEGNGILIPVVIAESHPLEWYTCSPFVIALATLFMNRFWYNISYNIVCDNGLNEFWFQVVSVKVKVTVTVAVFRKLCHHSVALI